MGEDRLEGGRIVILIGPQGLDRVQVWAQDGLEEGAMLRLYNRIGWALDLLREAAAPRFEGPRLESE